MKLLKPSDAETKAFIQAFCCLAIAAVIAGTGGCSFYSKDYQLMPPYQSRHRNIQQPPEWERLSQESTLKYPEEELKNYHRMNVTFIKMVSSENCQYSFSDEEIKLLKNLHINTIRICPLYTYSGLSANAESMPHSGSPMQKFRMGIPETVIINMIRKAHSEGFAVFLELNAEGPPSMRSKPSGYYNTEDINSIYRLSEKWGKIAEKEKVEFYSPLNEPNLMFKNGEALQAWIQESGKIKRVFSGNLVLKLGGAELDENTGLINISGYDSIAFDVIWNSKNPELQDYITHAVAKGRRIKEMNKLKAFLFGEIGAEKRTGKSTQSYVFKTILEETWNQTDGYCFLGWSDLEFSFKNNEQAKKIISEWFGRKR